MLDCRFVEAIVNLAKDLLGLSPRSSMLRNGVRRDNKLASESLSALWSWVLKVFLWALAIVLF